MKRLLVLLAGFACSILIAGCVATSKDMVRSTATSHQPEPGKALVVFMRPSRYGGAIQSSVYDTSSASDTFIGIVSSGTKVAYQADPGHHLFMVQGENADFMNADLDAGKTYYVLVSPRMGMWKARFSLLPIHNDTAAKYSLKSPNFQKWQADTQFVDKSATADAWYQAHAADISAKRVEYMTKWSAATEQQKAELTLRADDGI